MSGPVPRVKEPHLAGRWYPAGAAALADAVRAMLVDAGPPQPGVRAVIAPHSAYERSGPIAARAFAAAGGGHARAIVIGPTHHAPFRGAAVLPMDAYRTPLGRVAIDTTAIPPGPLVRANPAVFMREHAIEAQLPLLQVADPGCAVVPLLVGRLEPGDAEALADLLRPCLVPGTLVVVSSDLVHYGRRFDYLPVPPTDAAAVAAAVGRLDDGALECIVARDAAGFVRHVDETGATICGRRAIEILLRALPPGATGTRLAHGTSLEFGGDFTSTVGWAAVAFAA